MSTIPTFDNIPIMKINRNFYLEQIIAGKGNGLVKIITGIRRCGKSYLLFTLFHDYLNSQGVDDDHIIEIALDDRSNIELRDPDAILKYIKGLIIDKSIYYIILDEVQMIPEFTDVLNSLLHIRNVDVYVTGSNSHFLSSDIVTEFRGRGDEIRLYPLTFAEYCEGYNGTKQEAWKDYYTYGGLPHILALDTDKKKEDYLDNLYSSVYLIDVLERHKIRNRSEFDELVHIMASSIGSPCNPAKLSNTFKSVKGVTIHHATIEKYLSYLQDAFIIERAIRYNIKGKKYINTLNKYYFSDIGLRNAILGYRQQEENHIMENIIYNELRSRGYKVDIGMVETRNKDKNGNFVRKQLEVDFVVNQGSNRYYIQSAFAMPTKEKEEQEYASLLKINDSFKKIIVVKDDIKPKRNEYGILTIGIMDFLLNPNSLEL